MAKDERDYISLREASQLSGYSPDYIGQLIRSGKLHGKQVYQNVAWMTTAEDVREYMDRKKSGQDKASKNVLSSLNKLGERLPDPAKFLTPLLYVAIGFLACLFFVLFYAFTSTIERHLDQQAIQSAQKNQSL